MSEATVQRVRVLLSTQSVLSTVANKNFFLYKFVLSLLFFSRNLTMRFFCQLSEMSCVQKAPLETTKAVDATD